MQSGTSSYAGSSDNSQLSLVAPAIGHIAGNYGVPTWTKERYKNQYKSLPYLNNYVSGIRNTQGEVPAERRKAENERSLKAYYSSKIHFSRHDSIISGSSNPSVTSDNSRKGARMKHVTKSAGKGFNEHATSIRGTYAMSKNSSEVFSKGYSNYCAKLPIPGPSNSDLLRRHNMWIPHIKVDPSGPILDKERSGIPEHPGSQDQEIPGRHFTNILIHPSGEGPGKNNFLGSATMPPLFGEMKLPPFAYQCTVGLDDNIYTIGGLTPSYCYSDDMPDLNCYFVDGVENLPPPLLDSVVNNPSMVNNHDLYVVSTSSSRVRKPFLTGNIPPPLLCLTGSVLTKRHIFYYGGIEIKTETTVDEQTGKFFLKKRAYLHNTAYILDIVTFKFTKVELVAQPTEYNAYPATVPRFGHAQVSVHMNTGNSATKCSVCAAANPENKDEHENMIDCSSASQPSDIRSQSESSLLAEKASNNKLSNSLNSGVYTIIVTGGYRQINEDDYEALGDLWKIEVTVTARGKRNYFKFADTALATPFPKLSGEHGTVSWPAQRAFQVCEIYDTMLLQEESSEMKLLENLRANFHIEPERASPGPMSPGEQPASLSRHSHQHIYGDTSSYGILHNHNAKPSLLHSGKTMVMHGGSDKSHVYGDMWWFDLDSEQWTEVSTYSKNFNSQNALNSFDLTLVGHKLVRIASSAVFVGGMNQEDVNKHWGGGEIIEESKVKHNGSHFATLHFLDLNSQIFEHFYVGSGSSQGTEASLARWADQVRLVSTSAMYENGFLHLVGGFWCDIKNTEELYLRGTFTTCILPIITNPKLVSI